MALFVCSMCGALLEIEEGTEVCECDYCGSIHKIPRVKKPVERIVPTILPKEPSDFEIKEKEHSGKAEIYYHNPGDVPLIIFPNEIDGYKIMGIGEYAFSDFRGAEKVIVAEGIEYIENGNFDGCNALRDIYLPTSVKRIDKKSIPERAKIIYYDGVTTRFVNSSVGLPVDYFVKEVSQTGELEIISYIGDERYFDGVLEVPEKLQGKRVVGIGERAFIGLNAIEAIVIPIGVEYIKDYNFEECRHLKTVVLPSTLRSFRKSRNLKGIDFFQLNPEQMRELLEGY